MKAPAKLVRLFKIGRRVDRLFETITAAFEALYDQRFHLGTKKYNRQRAELEALADRLCDECTLSDHTKDVIAAVEDVEFDTTQTLATLDEVQAKWKAYQAKTKGTK